MVNAALAFLLVALFVSAVFAVDVDSFENENLEDSVHMSKGSGPGPCGPRDAAIRKCKEAPKGCRVIPCSVVRRRVGGKPGKSGKPGNPDRSGKHGKPDRRGKPGKPVHIVVRRRVGGKPGKRGNPDMRGKHGKPGKSDKRGKHGKPGKSDKRGKHGKPRKPVHIAAGYKCACPQ